MATNPAFASCRRPEHELLLCSASTVLDSERTARFRALLGERLDWTHLVNLAESHGILPLLYTHLKAQAPDALPPSLQADLQNRFQDNLQRAMRLTGVLVKLLGHFESNGISALAFKGPVLAEELYGNLALRPFADLDLILAHREIPRAIELMLAHNFVPEPGSAVHVGGRAVDTAGQFAFFSQDGAALVELHSEVTLRHFPRRPEPPFFFASPRLVTVAGRGVRTLDPTSLVLSLSVHGAKDFWSSLKWVVDIAEFLRVHSTLDWDDVRRRAEQLRCERMLRLAFLLAGGLLGVCLPDELRRSCDCDARARHLAAQLASGLLEGRELSARDRFSFRLRTHPHRWGGIRYAFRLAMTPAEEDRALSNLPGPLSSLLRPLRLFRKYSAGRRPASRPS